MPPRHILLVEDDSSSADLAKLLLKKIAPNVAIAHASDGVEALEYLEGRGQFSGFGPQWPVVILLDLKMPRLDGFGVLERMRETPEMGLSRVIVLSASAQERDVQRAYQLGACGYVVKSIDFDCFRSALQAIWDFWGVINQPPPAAFGESVR